MRLFIGILCCTILLQTVQAETVSEFINQGSDAFNQGDYVTSAYYLNRARNHADWDEYTGKMDVFTKMAYMEESQGHFEDAARYYREAIRYIPDTDEATHLRLEQYYYSRYAATLVRSGYYQAAEKIYWDLYDRVDLPEKTQIILQITENYKYQTVTVQQMDHLHQQIFSLDLQTLGWALAELYYVQRDIEKAYDVYHQIWQQNLPMAIENYLTLANVYHESEQIEQLINQCRQNFLQSPQYIELYILLMEYQNKSEIAKEELERYFQAVLQSNTIADAGILAGAVDNSILVKWVELIENSGNTTEAILRSEQLLSANPGDIVWRKRLSSLFLSQGQKEQAVQLWQNWFQLDQANDFQRFSAIEQMQQLGATEQAKNLFHQLEDKVPVTLKQFEARTALELGLYEHAISSFQIASISANVNPAGITNMVLSYVDAQADQKPVVSAFIKAASGNSFQETPAWLRDSLVECGVKYGFHDELVKMAEQDPAGLWAIHTANTAKKYGKTLLAQTLLDTVPTDSILRDSADQQFVELLSSNQSVPSQIQAADLILPSIEHIVSVTEPQNLTAPQIQQLLQYSEYRLHAYQPGLALKAIQTIEASTPFLQGGVIDTDVEKIMFFRATALSQLASYDPAVELLDKIQTPSFKPQADFLKAKIFLSQKKLEEADQILQQLVVDRSDWQLSNDALGYIIAMEPLFGEPMTDFCTLQTYLLQGRMEEAFTLLRSIAVDFYETDTEEWARYQIAMLKAKSGQWDDAVEEWKRLLLDVDHPVYHGLVHYKLTNVPSQANHLVESASQFQELMTKFPNSLFSDLARIEAEERSKGLYP